MKITSITFQRPDFLLTPAERTERRNNEQNLPREQRPTRVLGVVKIKRTVMQQRLNQMVEHPPLLELAEVSTDFAEKIRENSSDPVMRSGQHAYFRVNEALREWINDTNVDHRRRQTRKSTADLIWSDINTKVGSVSVGQQTGNVRIALSKEILISDSLARILKREGIYISLPEPHMPLASAAGPGPRTAAYRAAGATKLTTRAQYQDQLRAWRDQDGLTDIEQHARKAAVRQIRDNIKVSADAEKNLDLKDLSGLTSLPPLRFPDTTLTVARGQFNEADLERVRRQGAVINLAGSVHDGGGRRVPALGQGGPRTHRFIPVPSGPSRSSLQTTSSATVRDMPSTFQQQLAQWENAVPAEHLGRNWAARQILTWLDHNQIGSSGTQGQAQLLDLSARDGLRFSTMPPIPDTVTELAVGNQLLRTVEINQLPRNLRSLNLIANPLEEIGDRNLPDSLRNLIVNIGTTSTLPAHVVRRLNSSSWPSYVVNLPGISRGDYRNKLDHYKPEWDAVRESLQQWVDQGEADKSSREIAVQTLEMWLHQDQNQTADTPLDFGGLNLEQLPPVWPNARIAFIQAQGNRLQEIPLSSLPPSLKFLNLTDNHIRAMPPELRPEQMAARGNLRQDRVTAPGELASQMTNLGLPLTDPRTIDPRERESLSVILTGNPIANNTQTVAQYEARDFGPEYIISQEKLIKFTAEAEGSIEGNLLR